MRRCYVKAARISDSCDSEDISELQSGHVTNGMLNLPSERLRGERRLRQVGTNGNGE